MPEDAAFSRLLGLVEYPPPSHRPPTIQLTNPIFPHHTPRTNRSRRFRDAAIVFISFMAGLPVAKLNAFISRVTGRGVGVALQRGGVWRQGGVLLLYFGAPIAHERDQERALNFLLDLRDSLSNSP
ncbi:MAG: hypothetical protein IPL78_09705 [Chloroflexi bacterium]|nr:hypothetical protein [Chloroflexota bacterium]